MQPAMEFGSDAHKRELEKETCLEYPRQNYIEKFYGEFSYVILKTMQVVDITCLVVLIAEVVVWRDVEEVGVGDVLRGRRCRS